MARTGRFGRQPRQVVSLTSTLVAIAREFQNQRAQNVMDAWMKGGMFEGKKATDDVVLAFWKDKVAGVSKDDPLHDTYKNAHTQLDYTIHESKMTAGYAMKKYSDQQMVNFYLGWAKKVPKDSEFYRVLQRDAGQYMRTQQAATGASNAQAKEDRYQRQQAGTQKQKERAAEYAIDVFRRIAQSGYANGGVPQVIAAPGSGSDITGFTPDDPAIMTQLINAVSVSSKGDLHPTGERTTRESKGNTDVIYHDDDGRPVTGADIVAKFAKLDPNFVAGAPITTGYITGLIDTQLQGLNERIARARKTGHMTDVASLTKAKGYVAMIGRQYSAQPIQKAYMEAHADYYALVDDPSSSPQALAKGWETYSGVLASLSKDPRIEADDALRSRLIAEVNGTPGVPTLNESFTGLSNEQFDAASSHEAADNKAGVEFIQKQIEDVAAGKLFWTYGETNSAGVFVPKAGGRQVGAATVEKIDAGGGRRRTMTIDDPLGGGPITIEVTAVPVYGVANDPVTGEPLSTTNSTPIAWSYDLPKGDTFERTYNFDTKDGSFLSADPPWGGGIEPTVNTKDGVRLLVDFSQELERNFGYVRDPITGEITGSPALDANQDLPGGWQVRNAGGWDSKNGVAKPGEIVFNPQEVAWSTDTRNLAGIDPGTDFRSLTLANLMRSNEGRAILSDLDRNPAFKTTILNDAYTFAGADRDETGAWVPGTGDQNKMRDALEQQDIAVSSRSFGDFTEAVAPLWNRETTGGAYWVPNTSFERAAGTGRTETGRSFTKLPTDLVQGSPFEALGNAFKPGTNNLRRGRDQDILPGPVIKPISVIKAPELPDIYKVTQSSVGPMATQTSSQAPATTSNQGGQSGSSAPTAWKPPKQAVL